MLNRSGIPGKSSGAFGLCLGMAATLLTAPMALAQGTGNLLTNPGFDDPSSCYAGWTFSQALDGSLCASEPGTAWLNYNNQGADPALEQTVQGLTPGETYRLTVRWRPGDTAATYVNGATKYFAIQAGDQTWTFDADATDKSWRENSVEFTPSGTSATIRVIGEYGNVDGDVAVDSVHLASARAPEISTVEPGGPGEWLTSENVDTADTAPTAMSGPTRIGIRWTTQCPEVDIDLYVAQSPASNIDQFLYYGMTSTDFGRYGEDIRDAAAFSANASGLEEIELYNVPNLSDLQIRLNHYSGPCSQPINGTVRALFNNSVYEAPFTISGGPDAANGFGNAAASPSWQIIQPAELFKLQ